MEDDVVVVVLDYAFVVEALSDVAELNLLLSSVEECRVIVAQPLEGEDPIVDLRELVPRLEKYL